MFNIHIKKSENADTRSCDFTTVSQKTLLDNSFQHIADVQRALLLFSTMLQEAAINHDRDKITDIESFHADFVTGFAQTAWWDRHHLMQEDGIPDDVNLIDVLEMIADCVMAGMARMGEVYPLVISDALLQRAFQNTVTVLQSRVIVDHD